MDVSVKQRGRERKKKERSIYNIAVHRLKEKREKEEKEEEESSVRPLPSPTVSKCC